MVELGIILLILGAVGAIACHFAGVAVGIRIGLGVAILGGALILLGYLIPVLEGVGNNDTSPHALALVA